MAGDARPGLRLRKEQRLIKPGEFHRLREQGIRIVKGCLVANWAVRPEGARVSRIGVVTSRKVGNAVCRNRARRLLREVFRQHQHDLRRPVDLVLVARPSIVNKKLQQVERDFLAALRQSQLI